MADPFDVAGGSDPWQNLMSFGLATMAAGAKPGAQVLGSLGQGGLAAMQTARENNTAHAQNALVGAEAQSKVMQNSLSLQQLNMQRQMMGMPLLGPNGQPMDTQQQAPQQPQPNNPASNATGMTFSPTAGMPAHTAQSISYPSPGNTPAPANAAPSMSDNMLLLSGITQGRITPTPEIARQVAPLAGMINSPIAAQLADMAYKPITEGAIDTAKIHDIRPNGALYQGGNIVAAGSTEGVTPSGAGFRLPARATGVSSDGDTGIQLGAVSAPTRQGGPNYDPNQATLAVFDPQERSAPTPRQQRIQSAAPQMASDVPAGSVQTSISPGMDAYVKERGQSLGKRMGDIDEEATGAKQANFLLDQMTQDAQGFTPGKFADVKGELGKYMRTVDPKYDGSVAAYERFVKNAVTLTNEEVRQVSSRAAVQEYKAIQTAQPQPEMSPQGVKNIITQKYAINDYKVAKQAARDQWMQSHQTPEGFETDFNKNVTPAVFMIHRMDAPQLQAMRDSLAKTDGGKKVLNGLMQRYQYANQNGLLQ